MKQKELTVSEYNKLMLSKLSEEEIYFKIADYLDEHYPGVLYHFDFGSGTYLSKSQRIRQVRMNRRRGFPDLFIYEPKGKYKGLAIEIKRENTNLYNKKGILATEHIQEQMICLDVLNMKGYYAVFGIGFEDCKLIIDEYLKK